MAIIIVMLKDSGKLLGICTFLRNKGIELPLLSFIQQNASSGSLHSSGEGKRKSSYGLSLLTINAMREGLLIRYKRKATLSGMVRKILVFST